MQTAQLKRSASAHRVEATHAPASFERSEPPSRQDLEFLEAMRELQVRPNRRRVVPPQRLREVERVRIEDSGAARSEFLEAMERLGVKPVNRPSAGERPRRPAPNANASYPERDPAAQPGCPTVPGPAEREGTRPAAPEAAPERASTAAATLQPARPRAGTAKAGPEPLRFEEGGLSMADLLKSGLDPRDKYEGAPPAAHARNTARGRFAESDGEPDDQLDLHGKSQEEAIRMVQNFLLAAQRRGLRHVLVITGRGLRSGEHGPVLRDAVRLWLERNGGRFLREFRGAPRRHGGEGAFWIVMK